MTEPELRRLGSPSQSTTTNKSCDGVDVFHRRSLLSVAEEISRAAVDLQSNVPLSLIFIGLANGDTVFHYSGARNDVATRQFLKLKTGKDPGISGAWLHTHNLYRGTDEERICSQRTADRWKIGKRSTQTSKEEKVKFKSKRVMASEPVRSAREDRLERENEHLKRENKRLRGIELVVRSLAEKGGVDFDGIMQSAAADLSTSDSEGGFRRGPGDVRQHGSEKGMGSRTGG
ncbi:hypothetical protein ZWY2020_019130 [Hordeum vulgare]|nr:hypothetical protein ZWY2020_019130 [Hordeum vulgare]